MEPPTASAADARTERNASDSQLVVAFIVIDVFCAV
jgi:hypothetical protein